jgi:hypothetical protein
MDIEYFMYYSNSKSASQFFDIGGYNFLIASFLKDGPIELALTGYMKSTFSPASNKLLCATLHFDTGAVMAQMKVHNGFENGLALSSHTVQFVSNPPSDKGESDEESNAVATITLG